MGLSWLVAAGAATSVGLVAVGFAGAGLSGAAGPASVSVAVPSGVQDGSGGSPVGTDTSAAAPDPSPTPPEPSVSSGPEVSTGSTHPATAAATSGHTEHPHSGSVSTAPSTVTSSSGGSTSTQVTEGGTVVADCAAGWPRLLTWSPAPEWGAGSAQQGSASNPVATVTFRHDQVLETVSVTCRNGDPSFAVSYSNSSSDG